MGTTLPAAALSRGALDCLLFAGVPLIGSLAPEEIHSKGLLGYSCHLVIPCVYFDHHYIAPVSTQLLKAECSLQSGKSGEQLFERVGCPPHSFPLLGQGWSVKVVVVGIGGGRNGDRTPQRKQPTTPQMSHRLT